MQAANLTFLTQAEPSFFPLLSRQQIHCDFPKGVYYFSSRMRPIETTQYGNMQLVLNPITAAAGAYVLVAYEDFGLQSVISAAGSLPA